MRRVAAILFLLIAVSQSVFAQDGDGVLTNADVFVTTQFTSNLRVGPGTRWEVITVLQPGTTLRATGRVFNWVQVLYTPENASEPTHGWLYRNLLIWTGDINSLPLDGIDPETFLRAQAYTLTLEPDMYIYHNNTFGIGARVTEPLPCTQVEYTGRLGSGSLYWMQFWCEGEYYWVGSHNFFSIKGSTSSVFASTIGDNNFDYRYGHMVLEMGDIGYLVSRRASSMSSIWSSLSGGQNVSCRTIPSDVPALNITEDELAANEEFRAPVRSLEMAVSEVNASVALFRGICAQQGSPVTPQTISDGQRHVDEARTYLYLAQQFYLPLANRDPYAGGVNDQ